MNKKVKGIRIILAFVILLSLTGCAVRRKADGTSGEMEKMPVFRVEDAGIEIDEVVQLFLGMSTEEAEQYLIAGLNMYEVNGLRLTAIENESNPYVFYCNNNEGASDCYELMLMSTVMQGFQDKTMRQYFPQEDLDVCSKDEAIEACRPYAEACGYMNTEVSVYAVTLDIIEELLMHPDFGKLPYSAPDPEFEVITYHEINAVERQLKESEEGSNEYKVLLKRYEELESVRRNGASENGVPWEKKHEALLLTYQPYIDEYLMEEDSSLLYIVYVPLYHAPIYVHRSQCYQKTEVIEETEIVSSEEAIGEVLISEGYERDEIEVQKVSLVYAHQEIYTSSQKSWMKMIPCWSVEYIVDGKLEEVLIDAQYGTRYQNIAQH